MLLTRSGRQYVKAGGAPTTLDGVGQRLRLFWRFCNSRRVIARCNCRAKHSFQSYGGSCSAQPSATQLARLQSRLRRNVATLWWELMSKLVPITIACAEYDRTRAIRDGRVKVDGCEVTYLPLEPEELFFRAFRYHDFDVAELSFNSYLMTTSRNVCPYVAIPAFVSRHFRHSAVFIRTDRNIRGPADLKAKLVGLPQYQETANVWMDGILKEEYGIEPHEIHWRTGGQEEPGRDERTPLKLGGNIDLQPIAASKTLNKMLVDGELDAVFSARELSCFVHRAP